MTDAPSGFRRGRTIILLGALGLAMTVAGAVTALISRASASATAPGSIGTLPVHVYTQYTQRAAAPDLTGLGVGVAVAAVGAIVVLVCAVLSLTRMRAA